MATIMHYTVTKDHIATYTILFLSLKWLYSFLVAQQYNSLNIITKLKIFQAMLLKIPQYAYVTLTFITEVLCLVTRVQPLTQQYHNLIRLVSFITCFTTKATPIDIIVSLCFETQQTYLSYQCNWQTHIHTHQLHGQKQF